MGEQVSTVQLMVCVPNYEMCVHLMSAFIDLAIKHEIAKFSMLT